MSKEKEQLKKDDMPVYHRCLNCGSQDGYDSKEVSLSTIGKNYISIDAIKTNIKICKECGFIHLFRKKVKRNGRTNSKT